MVRTRTRGLADAGAARSGGRDPRVSRVVAARHLGKHSTPSPAHRSARSTASLAEKTMLTEYTDHAHGRSEEAAHEPGRRFGTEDRAHVRLNCPTAPWLP